MLVLITLPAAIPLLNEVTELNSEYGFAGRLDWLEQKMIAMEERAGRAY